MLRRWRPIAGLASAVVPAAVLVHLIAEGLALGRGAFTLDFALRHLYLVALAGASIWAFARSLGLGRSSAEIRRRTALVRAALFAQRRPAALALLVTANLAFFALTLLDEGLPILSGALWLGLGAGVFGSLLAAVLVAAFGRAALAAAVAALDWQPRRPSGALPCDPREGPARPRTAAASFSLFIPSRPPPVHPFIRSITLLEGIHPCSAWLARRIGRRRSHLEPLFS